VSPSGEVDLPTTCQAEEKPAMPTDSVRNRTFKEAFDGTVRFEIPFFQRGYAWEKKQWDQMFLDIQEQIIEDLDSGKKLADVEHFFGPIVVLERSGGTVALKEWLVIDGQQRITTVYLLLAVIKSEIDLRKHLSPQAADYVATLKKYLVNDVSDPDDYVKLKVFSSKGDRLPSYRVVFGTQSNPNSPLLQTDVQLYVQGENRVDEFHKYAVKKLKGQYGDVPALWRLAQALLNCLKVVWIPLDEAKDDPQAIFESLNDKGMPLKASELLFNYLFKPIIEAKEKYEDLHNNQWLRSIRDLGGDDRFEDYLRNLFSIDESKMVGKGRKLYVHFKSENRHLTAISAKQQLNKIHFGSSLYLNIREPLAYRHADEAINGLLISLSNTRMDSSTPFVLSVLRAVKDGAMDLPGARSILKGALVLLVRRKATELSTTQYDVMFPQLLSKIVHEPNRIKALHEQFRNHNVWISDQEFEHALIHKAAYRTRDLAFSRMLLVEIDKRLQTFGQLPDYTTVNTVEHMLPQTLDKMWKEYLGKDSEDERIAVITDSIGNLCLLSGPANSSAGQNPFSAKKASYSSITALARQIKDHPGPWNIQAILQRSEQLAEKALEI